MIASFFQHLEQREVEWLLISGQATILYGAATFSEDIDLWLKPEPKNFERFLQALRDVGARYYKLTPNFSTEVAARHHGFHFVVPGLDAGTDLYLDVMGYPPRVASFELAWKEARDFATGWGVLRAVGIRDLVEIKKTQRPRDYPIISRLALVLLRESTGSRTKEDLIWAKDHVFALDEFKGLVSQYPEVIDIVGGSVLERAAREFTSHGDLEPETEDALDEYFEQRAAPLRKADRRFWRPIIDELRTLRSQGRLMPEGTLV